MKEGLMLYRGPCARCGADTNGYATRDTRNPLTHRHIPVVVSAEVAEKCGAELVPVPPGLKVIRLLTPAD